MSKGTRQINEANYQARHDAAIDRWETPVSQQSIETHFTVPMLIAFVVSLFATAMVAAFIIVAADVLTAFSDHTLNPLNMFTIALTLATFALSFLGTFLWRIGVGDELLWKFEEATGLDVDGDGIEGNPYAPRSVPLNTKKGQEKLALPEKAGGLEFSEWQQVAIALLGQSMGKVSRRGVYDNCELSQAKSTDAVKHLEQGYAKDGELNQAGYDWLLSHLPQGVQCHLPAPSEGV